MPFRTSATAVIGIFLALLFAAGASFAQDETVETAEKLMFGQLDALKKGDYLAFVQNGNNAFKQFMDEYTFDSFKMQRGAKLAKGYRLEYLGGIRRIGMRKHLWKVHITGDKYQLFGSLSLSRGKVVGFNLE